jgi:tRNA A37 methylthiotransferase MiaB
VAKERSQMLIDLAREMEEAYFSKRQGQEARVLLEQKNDQGLWQGYTEDYIPCAIEEGTSAADLAEGEIVKTILKLNGPGLMHGEIA